jgi:tetratricopeptide (TPR) repeat protein
VLSLLALATAACGTSSEPASPEVSHGWVETTSDEHRPSGVRTCPSDLSDVQAAAATFRAALATADYDARGAAVDGLASMVKAHASDPEARLLLGLGELWTIAEPAKDADLATIGALAFDAKTQLEKAYALCPTDHRIPAWLGPIGARMGETLKDQKAFDQGIAILEQGIAEYPSFVLFSRVLIYANRPKGDPDFQKAVDAVVANIHACEAAPATATSLQFILDPACNNSPHAYHNLEGASVFLGDVFAKAGRREDAVRSYAQAKLAPNFADWNAQALLDERMAGIDARIASYDKDGPKDEAWNRTDQCTLCHAK